MIGSASNATETCLTNTTGATEKVIDPKNEEIHTLEVRSTQLGTQGTNFVLPEIIAQTEHHQHFVYYRACSQANPQNCIDGLIRNNTGFDPTIPPGDYQLQACIGAWASSAPEASEQAMTTSLYPQRPFYCFNSKNQSFTFNKSSSNQSSINQQAKDLYQSEIQLHKILYKFTDRIARHLENNKSDALSPAMQNTLGLGEQFHNFAISPNYDSAYEAYLQNESTLSNRTSTDKDIKLTNTGCVANEDLDKLSTQNQQARTPGQLLHPGLFLLSFGNSEASVPTDEVSSQQRRMNGLVAMQMDDDISNKINKKNFKSQHPVLYKLNKYKYHMLATALIVGVVGVIMNPELVNKARNKFNNMLQLQGSDEFVDLMNDLDSIAKKFHEQRTAYRQKLKEFHNLL